MRLCCYVPQVVKVCKLCTLTEGAEGTKKSCAKNLDADPPAHDWFELEEVSDELKNTYTFPCNKCPDAKYYPEKKGRPNMKSSVGNSNSCRNPACPKAIREEKPADEPKPKRIKRDSEASQPARAQPVRLKGHAKMGMKELDRRIKELQEELDGLLAVRELALAGAAREPEDVDEEDDDDYDNDDDEAEGSSSGAQGDGK